MSGRFAPVRAARLGVTPFLKALEPDRYTGAEAAEGIKEIAKLERLLAGARIRLAKRIDDSVSGAEGEDGPESWLANQTGQNPKDAAKDIDTSKSLDDLDATDEALANGDLSPTQAHEVSSAAAADPSAEKGAAGDGEELLGAGAQAKGQEGPGRGHEQRGQGPTGP